MGGGCSISIDSGHSCDFIAPSAPDPLRRRNAQDSQQTRTSPASNAPELVGESTHGRTSITLEPKPCAHRQIGLDERSRAALLSHVNQGLPTEPRALRLLSNVVLLPSMTWQVGLFSLNLVRS